MNSGSAVITDEQWIKAGKIAISEYGLERYLTNVFDSVERSFGAPFPRREEWMNTMEKRFARDEMKVYLSDLLKDLRRFYKKCRITTPIPVVILQNINIFSITLNIGLFKSFISWLACHSIRQWWVCKSSDSELSNPPKFYFNPYTSWRKCT